MERVKIELSAKEIDFAVNAYMAVKGYRVETREYVVGQNKLQRVVCHGVSREYFEFDQLIELIKNH